MKYLGHNLLMENGEKIEFNKLIEQLKGKLNSWKSKLPSMKETFYQFSASKHTYLLNEHFQDTNEYL